MDTGPQTIRTLLNRSEAHLVEHGVPNARRNVEWMLAQQLRCPTIDLYTRSETAPPRRDAEQFWVNIERRARREPLQYILGNTEFMSLPFEVPTGVFIPRPDTELLVETAEKMLRGHGGKPARGRAVLDLCCGSGVIAVSLACRLPGLVIAAVDSSELAVEVTRTNAGLNNVAGRVACELSAAADFLASRADGARSGAEGGFAAVVCNPPYIESGAISGLPPEVREHEPREALDGGRDGLDFYREVIPLLPRCLAAGGFVALEIGDEQATAVTGLLRDAGLGETSVTKDYAGHDRVVVGRRPGGV